MTRREHKLPTPGLLIETIVDPRAMLKLDLPEWERLLSCARRNAVLAYLAQRAEVADILDDFPPGPRAAHEFSQGTRRNTDINERACKFFTKLTFNLIVG